MDLGPVVGSNVTFFGERLGCKIILEDLFGDLDRYPRNADIPFAEYLKTRLKHEDGSVDGILCWNFFDYLDLPSAQATENSAMRRPSRVWPLKHSEAGTAPSEFLGVASERSTNAPEASASRLPPAGGAARPPLPYVSACRIESGPAGFARYSSIVPTVESGDASATASGASPDAVATPDAATRNR